jgi:hypothetical protein
LLQAHGLTLYEPGDLRGRPASPEFADLRQIATWAVEFLSAPHPRLGRRGPVCPYTRLSMDNNAFLLAWAGGEHDVPSIESTVEQYRRWFIELLAPLEGPREQLLTILVVLPVFDRTESGPLDALQRRLKDAFVAEGLMVGQFHPRCEQRGLWNDDFRPLRAPIPLLAIRRMVSSDLPFLLDSGSQMAAYFNQFAADIPAHIRRILIERILQTADSAEGRRVSA